MRCTKIPAASRSPGITETPAQARRGITSARIVKPQVAVARAKGNAGNVDPGCERAVSPPQAEIQETMKTGLRQCPRLVRWRCSASLACPAVAVAARERGVMSDAAKWPRYSDCNAPVLWPGRSLFAACVAEWPAAGMGGMRRTLALVSFGVAVRPICVALEKYSSIRRHAASSAVLPRDAEF